MKLATAVVLISNRIDRLYLLTARENIHFSQQRQHHPSLFAQANKTKYLTIPIHKTKPIHNNNMRISLTPSINNAITAARTYGIQKTNAKESRNLKQEQVNDQKKVVSGIRSEMDKATDGPTYRYLESKLHAAERQLDILELELAQCIKEVHEYELQEAKAGMNTLVENNGTQKAADMIMNNVFAKMEADFSSNNS